MEEEREERGTRDDRLTAVSPQCQLTARELNSTPYQRKGLLREEEK